MLLFLLLLLLLLLLIVLVATSRVQCVELRTLFLYSDVVWLHDVWSNNLRSLIFLVFNKSGISPGIPCLVANEIVCPSLLFVSAALFH